MILLMNSVDFFIGDFVLENNTVIREITNTLQTFAESCCVG